jgi:hypothetical protein
MEAVLFAFGAVLFVSANSYGLLPPSASAFGRGKAIWILEVVCLVTGQGAPEIEDRGFSHTGEALNAHFPCLRQDGAASRG